MRNAVCTLIFMSTIVRELAIISEYQRRNLQKMDCASMDICHQRLKVPTFCMHCALAAVILHSHCVAGVSTHLAEVLRWTSLCSGSCMGRFSALH